MAHVKKFTDLWNWPKCAWDKPGQSTQMIKRVRLVVARVERDALTQVENGLFELLLQVKAESQFVVDVRVLGVLLECSLQVRDAVAQFVNEQEQVAPLHVEIRVVRVQLDGAVEVLVSLRAEIKCSSSFSCARFQCNCKLAAHLIQIQPHFGSPSTHD